MARQHIQKQLMALRDRNLTKARVDICRYGKYKGRVERTAMTEKDKAIRLFVVFCIEEYGAAKRMRGEQVLALFSRYGVTRYLSQCFEPLHTQGRQWLIEEIDEFIACKSK